MGLGILIGMLLGAVAWHLGLLRMEHIQKRGGCYRHCAYCGRPYNYPLTYGVRRRDKGDG